MQPTGAPATWPYLRPSGEAPLHERPDAASLSLGVSESMSPHRPDPARRVTAAAGWCRRPVSGELLRLRLVETLARRWDVAVTTVVAGAGLGKSTALAQSIRHHHARPAASTRGCRANRVTRTPTTSPTPSCGPSARPAPASDAAGAVINALRSTSPLAVCLVIDDVHELPGAARRPSTLLADVVRALPAHAHLVLAGRPMPALPLARLRAAERVLDDHPGVPGLHR